MDSILYKIAKIVSSDTPDDIIKYIRGVGKLSPEYATKLPNKIDISDLGYKISQGTVPNLSDSVLEHTRISAAANTGMNNVLLTDARVNQFQKGNAHNIAQRQLDSMAAQKDLREKYKALMQETPSTNSTTATTATPKTTKVVQQTAKAAKGLPVGAIAGGVGALGLAGLAGLYLYNKNKNNNQIPLLSPQQIQMIQQMRANQQQQAQ